MTFSFLWSRPNGEVTQFYTKNPGPFQRAREASLPRAEDEQNSTHTIRSRFDAQECVPFGRNPHPETRQAKRCFRPAHEQGPGGIFWCRKCRLSYPCVVSLTSESVGVLTSICFRGPFSFLWSRGNDERSQSYTKKTDRAHRYPGHATRNAWTIIANRCT